MKALLCKARVLCTIYYIDIRYLLQIPCAKYCTVMFIYTITSRHKRLIRVYASSSFVYYYTYDIMSFRCRVTQRKWRRGPAYDCRALWWWRRTDSDHYPNVARTAKSVGQEPALWPGVCENRSVARWTQGIHLRLFPQVNNNNRF